MDITEKGFEDQIEAHLVGVHHYRRRDNTHYDPGLCLDWELLLEFITATQPESWLALKQQHGPAVVAKFLQRLNREIQRRGTLDGAAPGGQGLRLLL